jgi:FtsZ-binding cell division protein ZapB
MIKEIIFLFKEELREQNKVLRGAQRDIDRDRNQLEREKKRLVRI